MFFESLDFGNIRKLSSLFRDAILKLVISYKTDLWAQDTGVPMLISNNGGETILQHSVYFISGELKDQYLFLASKDVWFGNSTESLWKEIREQEQANKGGWSDRLSCSYWILLQTVSLKKHASRSYSSRNCGFIKYVIFWESIPI